LWDLGFSSSQKHLAITLLRLEFVVVLLFFYLFLFVALGDYFPKYQAGVARS